MGRFITPDTEVLDPYDPQSLNRYAYVRNNPLIYTDPTGHYWYQDGDGNWHDEVGPPVPENAARDAALTECWDSMHHGDSSYFGLGWISSSDFNQWLGTGSINTGTRDAIITNPLLDPVEIGVAVVTAGTLIEGKVASKGLWSLFKSLLKGGGLRQEYVKAVKSLAGRVPAMRQAGKSAEEIARALHAERRALGEQFKSLTPSGELARIYERNLERYGDKLGPSIEWLRVNANKSWEQIIESATRPGGMDLGY